MPLFLIISNCVSGHTDETDVEVFQPASVEEARSICATRPQFTEWDGAFIYTEDQLEWRKTSALLAGCNEPVFAWLVR